jgi:hypothetical protein
MTTGQRSKTHYGFILAGVGVLGLLFSGAAGKLPHSTLAPHDGDKVMLQAYWDPKTVPFPTDVGITYSAEGIEHTVPAPPPAEPTIDGKWVVWRLEVPYDARYRMKVAISVMYGEHTPVRCYMRLRNAQIRANHGVQATACAFPH